MESQTIIQDYDRQFSWHNYNESQTKEKAIFVNILSDLSSLIEEKEINSVGRKRTKTKDIIFSIVLKQYLNTSSRRLQSDLKLFSEANFIDSEIPFNTLLDNMEREELKHLLRELIEISALPLKQIERDFAIDSTGFSTSRYETYFDVRYGKPKTNKQRVFRKCHAVCGVKTNIIISVDITEGFCSDQNMFIPLAGDTARNFIIRDFCADKGYLAGKHFAFIKELGGQAFIPFKSNSSGNSAGSDKSYFRRAHRFFRDHKEEYLRRYHKRSNIESCFSMIKRKFGTNVKCKKEISQDNEILAKVLAHNICVLVQEIFLNKIHIDFVKCREDYISS